MDEAPESSEPAGLPGWVMTFADLMTLLMCFFVLMLSFSEMDVAKFKQLAGSMQEAFGVQAEIEVKTIPKGTSIIAQEFSPGTPERTILNEVRQFTVNSNMNSLDVGSERLEEVQRIQEQEERAEVEAGRLRTALRREIEDGSLLIRRERTNVIVQILERDSFRSGSAALEPDFLPTLSKIGVLLRSMRGAISVSGHTDNVPISTSQYRSNWDLSAARAATVAHELLQVELEPERIMISGHADTQPRAANETAAGRALNRRIDITLVTNRDRHGGWASDDPAADGTGIETDGGAAGPANGARGESTDGAAAGPADDAAGPMDDAPGFAIEPSAAAPAAPPAITAPGARP
jgi:chemotaxis protein MotB